MKEDEYTKREKENLNPNNYLKTIFFLTPKVK